MFFEQILYYSLKPEPLPPLISELNSKFLYASLCVLNRSLIRVWLTKILYRNLISIKSYPGQPLGVSSSPTPAPPPPRVNTRIF